MRRGEIKEKRKRNRRSGEWRRKVREEGRRRE